MRISGTDPSSVILSLLTKEFQTLESDIQKVPKMRILGTDPLSVILNQTKEFKKVEKGCPKSVETS